MAVALYCRATRVNCRKTRSVFTESCKLPLSPIANSADVIRLIGLREQSKLFVLTVSTINIYRPNADGPIFFFFLFNKTEPSAQR